MRSVGVGLVIGGLVAGLAGAFQSAEATGTKVNCARVQQDITGVDTAVLAEFMAAQIGAGRTNFHSVSGTSAVICAW